MEDFLSEATSKETEKLLEINDPEDTPYLSKYKARDILDSFCNQMEANKTIASLEKKKEIMNELDWRIASIRLRLGSIAWDVEEPHNAQIELDLAAEFYTPGIVTEIEQISGQIGSDISKDIPEDMIAPDVNVVKIEFCADAMKCLNLLGILWAGRDHAKRSFLYLLASKKIYDNNISNSNLTIKQKEEMESTLTHNLFYLAQAYGNNGNPKLSSYYCQQTLQRQLIAGLDVKSGIEWVKNCMGMADFHTALRNTKSAAYALGAAENVFNSLLKPLLISSNNSENTTLSSNDLDRNEKIKEIEDDLNRRWITLDVGILKVAMENKKVNDPEAQSVFKFDKSSNDNHSTVPDHFKFPSLEVIEIQLSTPEEIITFENAREVFLRAVTKLEIAKQTFPLEGFVTDHVQLVRQHSLLYHYLSSFETDIKRKLAMELRRAEMLRPFINSLGRTAYEKLHKEISYELGEVYLNIFEFKLLKISEKNPQAVNAPEKYMKANDIIKTNEYCLSSISMFYHFLSFYTKDSNDDTINRVGLINKKDYGAMTPDELINQPCVLPSWELIAEEEIRPFLNAHFLAARMFSRVLSSIRETPHQRTKFMVCALHRYQWLLSNASIICEKKSVTLNDVFGEEITICREMVALLPPKIDRMHYLGEGGL